MNIRRSWFGDTARPATVTAAGLLTGLHGGYLLMIGVVGTVLTITGIGYDLGAGDSDTRAMIGIAAPVFIGWPLLSAATGIAVLLTGRTSLARRRRWPIIGMSGLAVVVAVPWLGNHAGGLLTAPGYLVPLGVIILLLLTGPDWWNGVDRSAQTRIGGFD